MANPRFTFAIFVGEDSQRSVEIKGFETWKKCFMLFGNTMHHDKLVLDLG